MNRVLQNDRKRLPEQLELFRAVDDIYLQARVPLSNEELYQAVIKQGAVSDHLLNHREPIGENGELHSPMKRKIRWYQQTLKMGGVLERLPGSRGVWQLTPEGKKKLTPAFDDISLVAFSSDLGIAIWSNCERALNLIDFPVHLCLTSPPYPLKVARAYGNPRLQDYIDFICKVMEPVVEKLVPGGSICLNVSNDIFEHNSPARSAYREYLVVAMIERFSLYKMDTLCWENLSKPPGPYQWASRYRYQLNVGYEPIYWFTNDPLKVRSDNRRVLLPHTPQHMKLIEQGGENRNVSYGDGAYRIKPGAFGQPTAGRIPKNVLQYGHNCPSQRLYRKYCQDHNLPYHQATMPLKVAEFLINFLTEAGEVVLDPMSGSGTSGVASEKLGRKWVIIERYLEYLQGAASRFLDAPGFIANFQKIGVFNEL